MDATFYEMTDPDVTIRRLTKKLFASLWLKHGLIATLPPPGPTSPQRINDMTEKIAKSVLVYSYASRSVLQYYMEKHSQRIGRSKIAFWTHVSFLCLRIRLLKDNLFDYFLNICSIISEVALFCTWKKLDDVHTYASTFFAAFFESELSYSFYSAGGWAGLMNYIEDNRLIEMYKEVEPYRNEMESPCDLVPIMITVVSETLSAKRRERLASSRELRTEEIEQFEPVRLLIAKIFKWDFMEQLHISSLKPGVFRRMANIRRKSKGKTVFTDLPKLRCSRQLYITGEPVLQDTSVNADLQMNSSPNLRASGYDTPQRDSKVFQRSVSVSENPTSSLYASPMRFIYRSVSVDGQQNDCLHKRLGLMKRSKSFHSSRSISENLTSSLDERSSWMKYKYFHRSISVDESSTSSFLVSSSWLKAQETTYKRPVSKSSIKDHFNDFLKSSESIHSTTVQQTRVTDYLSEDNSTSETSQEILQNVEHSRNIRVECCGNETTNVNTTPAETSKTFVSKRCSLDSKTKLLKNLQKPKYSSEVQINKEIPFEKQVNLRVEKLKQENFFDANDFSSAGAMSKEPVSSLKNSCNYDANLSQSKTEYSGKELRKKEHTEFEKNINQVGRPEACATVKLTNNLNLECSETEVLQRYQSFDFTADGIESVTVKPNSTVHYKKQLFGNLATRKYCVKQSTVNDIEYLESLSRNKRFNIDTPGVMQKDLTAKSEITESENEPLTLKRANNDKQLKELVKTLEKSGISNPVVFKI